MKTLIIGSEGFIGQHCVSYFSQFGEVWRCDVVPGYDYQQYFRIDPSNTDFKEIFRVQQFELCINCSGASSVPDSWKYPARDFELNLHNVFLLLNALREIQPACKFINLSSAAVYGNPVKLPIKESDSSNPISPYGHHKQLADQLCAKYAELYHLRTVSVRIFSAYGPGLKKQLLWDIYQKSRVSTELELFGTGEETRDFIYVKDIVKALKVIEESAVFNGEVFNIASGIQVKIKELSELLLAELEWDGILRFNNQVRKGDPVYWQGDIQKLQDKGFYPAYSLPEGIKEHAKWLKGQ